ncbi:glycosyltransferase family 4 protein [Cognatishimia sp. SS12]|uniref:glycosyltransferase family 4 protein n=1 Tax=Cognatishimia sp. SS12 TaxID=2979465 RepID=UPI00232E9EE4|nr:glycosyltransferase family 4 protein [Cognatishimia sp. SS12]MDC0736827.1 glycosyltransferase family 4 protein [Cognatishimia sp. SS12]
MGALSHIAYLTGEYPRATDTFIQREVAALRALGHDVSTCSIRRTGAAHLVGAEQRAEAARTFHVLEAAKKPLHLLRCHLTYLRRDPRRYGRAMALALRTAPGGLRALAYQLFYFAEAAVLADHLEAQGVTHLHNHIAKSSCTVAMLMSELSGIPFSFTLHGPDIFFAPDRWALGEKVARARFVACISHFCRSQAMSFSPPEAWEKLHIVHCGVDPDRYGGTPGAGGNKLLFVGRLAAVKGLPVLLQAMQAAPDLTLDIIGDGPDRAALEAQAQGLGLSARVRFLGYKSQSEVAEALIENDIFVLPSFAEGVPVVLMEAMAAARPVVTTRIAGVPELVKDGASGLLVPPGDIAALTEALVRLASDPERQKAMGTEGRAKILAEFTLSQEAGWLSQLFEGYAEGRASFALRPAEDAP